MLINELLGYELSGKLIVLNFILFRAFIVCAVGITISLQISNLLFLSTSIVQIRM